jgi:DNA-binding beta-propeller fold protein YncE
VGLNPTQLNGPTGLYFDEPNNMLYIANEESHSITQWQLDTYGTKSIYAGIPGRPGNTAAQLFAPQGITLDKYGNLYVADCMNHRIQMFCPYAVYGITVAGTGQIGNASDELHFPRDVAFDADLNLYVTDTYNYRIQKFERIQ